MGRCFQPFENQSPVEQWAQKIVRTREDADDGENFGVPGLLGGLEGLRHFRGVIEHVADLAGIHLCDNLFRDTESDEAAAMLELATTLGAGFLAWADFVGLDLGAIDGHGGKWMG
jgi:hypothetical protein